MPSAPPTPPQVQAELTPREMVTLYADKYGVDEELMLCLVSHENKRWNPKAQSDIIYSFSDAKRGIVKGEYEKSFGLAMIHLPDHPEVTLEQATDAEFSIEFMAKNIAKGRKTWWTTMRYCQ